VLTAALATGALAACTDETAVDATPTEDPDGALATEALRTETAILALIDSLTAGRPRRLHELGATRGVHEAHVLLLGEAATPTSSPTPPSAFTGDDRAAYLALAQAEDRAGQTLRRVAFRASSGPFARVLAAMAAASAQQSARLRSLA